MYDLSKWDELIRWEKEYTNQYIEELKLPKKQINAQGETKEQAAKTYREGSKEEISSVETKVGNEQKISNIEKKEEVVVVVTSTVTNKEKIKHDENKIETISSNMNNRLRKVINEIKQNYYVQMQPRDISITDMENKEEYIKLLQDIQNSGPEEKKNEFNATDNRTSV